MPCITSIVDVDMRWTLQIVIAMKWKFTGLLLCICNQIHIHTINHKQRQQNNRIGDSDTKDKAKISHWHFFHTPKLVYVCVCVRVPMYSVSGNNITQRSDSASVILTFIHEYIPDHTLTIALSSTALGWRSVNASRKRRLQQEYMWWVAMLLEARSTIHVRGRSGRV